MARGVTAVAIACVLTTAASVGAQLELKNDSFASGQMPAFQGGFSAGEIGAVRLVPTGSPPFSILSVRLLFGGDPTPQIVTLNLYDDSAGTPTPGAVFFTGDYTLTPSDAAFSEIDLSGDGVIAQGPFRVGIVFQHTGFPGPARDLDGVDNTRNFIFAQGLGWVSSGSQGVTGDWIIRAFVLGGSAADAGPSGGPDGGSGQSCVLNSDCPNGQYCDGEACGFDCRLDIDCAAGSECNAIGQCIETSAGCCQVSGGGEGPLGALILFLLVAITLRRRSRACC